VLGIVIAAGSPLSHGAILARALGIPAVVGAGDDVLRFLTASRSSSMEPTASS
jgi:phosphocarrier protein FPr